MKPEEIEALFEKLAHGEGTKLEASKPIFTLLVQIALKYREMLVQKGEKTLTVEETKEALDELLLVMKNKKYSDTISLRIRQLVILWYDEVRVYLYN